MGPMNNIFVFGFLYFNLSNILYVNINVFWYVGMYVYEDLNIYY